MEGSLMAASHPVLKAKQWATGVLSTRPHFPCQKLKLPCRRVIVSSVQAEHPTVSPINGTSRNPNSILEGSLQHRKCVGRFVIRSYEVGANRKASMETIAYLLQEVACNHARSAGFSTDGFATTLTMREHGLIWVMTRMHIEVEEYPHWGDTIEIETWFQFEGRIGTRRDWSITNVSTGKTVARATSTWGLMNQATRRLSRVNEDVRNEFSLLVMIPPKETFEESKKQIPRLDEYEYVKENLKPEKSDLDMNKHVNNVTYIRWVLQSLPLEIENTHELHSLTMEFRCECNQDDAITTSAAMEESSDSEVFTHLVKLACSNKEVSRSRTKWRKL